MNLALTLRYRNETKLDELIAAQLDNRSGQYRHWLTNAQFNAMFAPSTTDYARVVRSLKDAGFHIAQTYPNRTVIDVAGMVSTVERYFHTVIHRVHQDGVGERYINVQAAYAPMELQKVLLSVGGMNTVQVVRTDLARVERRAGVIPPCGKPQKGGLRLFGPTSCATGYNGYGPLAISTAYDLPIMHTTGSAKRYDGSGRSSGIVISELPLDSDIDGFLAYFRIKRTGPPTTYVPVDGGTAEDGVEATLDAETSIRIVSSEAV